MRRGREHHACAVRGNDVFVMGGEVNTKSSIEIWSGTTWTYSTSPIGGTFLKLLPQGKNLFLFGSWEKNQLTSQIWKINENNRFIKAGSTAIARAQYTLFSIQHDFLTNCKGMQVY